MPALQIGLSNLLKSGIRPDFLAAFYACLKFERVAASPHGLATGAAHVVDKGEVLP